ncbi:N-acetyltransferase family protein [Chitinophaga sp. NPDC101104]|uniref:GNAT family N-acetyltransferase n=1 Tax=Chitinophaga sp. NPDC101104 TaxID=3390561 RepID=UPI003CFFD572
MEQLTYRNALQADLPQIVAIYNSTIASRMVTADTEPVSTESRQHWFDIHTPERRPLWVVENEGKDMVGWISFQSFYGRPAYNATVEISIYLDENFRGKGFGREMLKYAIQHAPSFEVKTLLGFIFAHNTPSLRLFRSLGFEDWGTLPDIAELDGKEVGLKIVGKRVG